MSYTGFAYLFEYVVVVLFRGYEYRPKFLKNKELDNIVGSVWSQLFYVPVAALFITAFKFGWKMKLFYSLFFAMIEKFFIQLGIFRNFWWKTRYTFVMIYFSFLLNDYWKKGLDKRNSIVLNISFFNMVQATWMNTVFVLALMKKVQYGIGNHFNWKEHLLVSPIRGLIVSVAASFLRVANKPTTYVKLLLTMVSCDLFLFKKGMLKVNGWFVLPIIYSTTLVSTYFYKSLLFSSLKKEDKVPERN